MHQEEAYKNHLVLVSSFLPCCLLDYNIIQNFISDLNSRN